MGHAYTPIPLGLGNFGHYINSYWIRMEQSFKRDDGSRVEWHINPSIGVFPNTLGIFWWPAR